MSSRFKRLVTPPDTTQPEPFLAPAQVTENVLDNDVLVPKTTLVSQNPRENLKKWKVSDFELQNIVAIGAIDKLKPSQYVSSVDPAQTDVLSNKLTSIVSPSKSSVENEQKPLENNS